MAGGKTVNWLGALLLVVAAVLCQPLVAEPQGASKPGSGASGSGPVTPEEAARVPGRPGETSAAKQESAPRRPVGSVDPNAKPEAPVVQGSGTTSGTSAGDAAAKRHSFSLDGLYVRPRHNISLGRGEFTTVDSGHSQHEFGLTDGVGGRVRYEYRTGGTILGFGYSQWVAVGNAVLTRGVRIEDGILASGTDVNVRVRHAQYDFILGYVISEEPDHEFSLGLVLSFFHGDVATKGTNTLGNPARDRTEAEASDIYTYLRHEQRSGSLVVGAELGCSFVGVGTYGQYITSGIVFSGDDTYMRWGSHLAIQAGIQVSESVYAGVAGGVAYDAYSLIGGYDFFSDRDYPEFYTFNIGLQLRIGL